MKKLFFILFLWKGLIALGQPAIIQNATWITKYEGFNVSYFEYWKQFQTTSDTLINGVNYTNIYENYMSWYGPTNTYTNYGSKTYIASYRNDSYKRAFIILPNETVERLWYDFNLSIGDTIHSNDFYSVSQMGNNNFSIVSSIDSIYLCNRYYKQFHFTNVLFNFPNLVEGVGFTGDLINQNWGYFEFFANLSVFSDSAHLTQCANVANNINEIEDLNMVTIYPNPSENVINIEIPFGNSLEFKFANIFNIHGTKLNEYKLTKGANKIITNLNDGTYFLELTGDIKTVRKKVFIFNNR